MMRHDMKKCIMVKQMMVKYYYRKIRGVTHVITINSGKLRCG